MATIRTCVVQTCNSGNTCLSLLTSIPCLLGTLLFLNSKSAEPKAPSLRRPTRFSLSHDRANRLLRPAIDLSLRLPSPPATSLRTVLDQGGADFAKRDQESDFVHALDLECQEIHTYGDFNTVESEVMSATHEDPNSTEISVSSDFECSETESL